jgi:hypothetical protein
MMVDVHCCNEKDEVRRVDLRLRSQRWNVLLFCSSFGYIVLYPTHHFCSFMITFGPGLFYFHSDFSLTVQEACTMSIIARGAVFCFGRY